MAQRLVRLYILLGSVLCLAAVAWWAVLFSVVGKQMNTPLAETWSCLVAVSAYCNTFRGLIWLRGITPYEPLLLWLGLAIVGITLSLRAALVKR